VCVCGKWGGGGGLVVFYRERGGERDFMYTRKETKKKLDETGVNVFES
jgi:hypothetical protein